MAFMKRVLLHLLFLGIISCGTANDGSSDGAIVEKSIFSKWEDENTTFYLDFTNGVFDTNQTLYIKLPISQIWIDLLSTAGRDITGLVAGTYYICEMTIFIVGTEASGNIATNHDNVDTPAHNACLEWDSNCSIGECNYSNDHLYTKSGSNLLIDYFGTSDNGTYGIGSLF